MRETGKENQKIIKCRYYQIKNLPIWTKDREEKTEIGGEKKDLLRIRCYSVFNGVELPSMLTAFKFLDASLGKQISGYLPASGSKKSN